MIGYIIIAVAVVIVAYIVILYFVNNKKIKQKQAKKAEPEKKAEATEKKPVDKTTNMVEVKSQVIKGTMFEEAVKEAERAGYKYEDDQEYENVYKREDNSRLKLDRKEFVSEIKRADRGRMTPQRLKLDRPEGPVSASKKNQQSSKTNKDSLGEQINNLSPELKALLINDVLNKKY